MDIHALDYQMFSKDQVHAWLNGARQQLAQGVRDVAAAFNTAHRALWKEDNHAGSQTLAQWCQENDMLTTHPAGGHTWSLRGVAFLHSSLNDRLPASQAWDRVHAMMRKVDWLNNAPENIFPLTVADVLLFGSMTKSAATCGDSDALVLVTPKSENAQSQAAAFWKDNADWCPQAYGMMSFHRLIDEVLSEDGFCSWTLDPSVVDVLSDQDPDFALVSALGKTWTPFQVSATQMDEVAFAVCQALDHAPHTMQSQVWQQLSRARLRHPSVEQQILSDVTNQLLHATTTVQIQRCVWWALVAPQEEFKKHYQSLDELAQHRWQKLLPSERLPSLPAPMTSIAP